MENIIEFEEGSLIEGIEIMDEQAVMPVTNGELVAGRDPMVIAAEINVIKAQTAAVIKTLGGQIVSGVYEIGRLLCEAKESVPRGEWGAWLETNVAYSDSTAQNFMKIYRELSDGQVDMLTGKTQAELFAGLDYSRMVEVFKLPKDERARLAEENDLAGMSAREVKALVKEKRDLEAEVKRLQANGGADFSANISDAAKQGYEESFKKEVEAVKRDYEAKLTEKDDEIVDLTVAKGRAEMQVIEEKGKAESADKARIAAEDALKKAESDKEKAVKAAEKAAKAELKALQKELDDLKKVPPAAEVSAEDIERIKAEAIAEVTKKHEEELEQIRFDGERRAEDIKAEAEGEEGKRLQAYKADFEVALKKAEEEKQKAIRDSELRIAEMKEKLIAASDDTVKVVSVLIEQVSEILTKITERVESAPDEVKGKLSGALNRLLISAADSFKAE